MGIRVLVTGATGMVGEGVLHECLQSPEVDRVVVLGRRPCGYTHDKLTEIVVSDLYAIDAYEEQLSGLDACLFCLGTSSIGKSEAEFTRISHTLTLHIAQVFLRANPQSSFSYISGMGTDSSEKGRTMWARVKGRTENDLAKLGFSATYAFRPGYLHPTPGMRNTLSYYRYIGWLYPALRLFTPQHVSRLSELGRAMIAAHAHGFSKRHVEVADIVILAKGAGSK